MSLATDVQTLVNRGMHYAQHYETFPLAWHGATNMVFGAFVPEKSSQFRYVDLHVHIPVTASIRPVLQEAAKRVDVLAITGRTLDNTAPYDFSNHLIFEDAVEKMEQEGIEHKVLGNRVAIAYPNGKKKDELVLVRTTEVYPREMQGVVIVGSNPKQNWYHGKPTIDEVVKAADDVGAVRFFDHPFSIYAPHIFFRYPTKEEVRQRLLLFVKYQAIIEVGNHQNTLWMYLSNEIAKDIAKKEGLVGIANSDSHFNPHDIGRSRTGIPKAMLDLNSEEGFLASLKTALSPKNKKRIIVEANYSSIWAFGQYMIAPTALGMIKQVLGKKK